MKVSRSLERLWPVGGIASVFCLMACLSTSANAQGARLANNEGEDASGTQSVISSLGVDVSKDAHSFFSTTLIALNGDLGRDGLILRWAGNYGKYDYDAGLPLGQIDAKERSFDVMLGYQATIGLVTATAYVGYEFINVDLSPFDPDNSVQGSESGFKVAVEAETSDEIPLFVSLNSSYSTAFDTFNGFLRLGYNKSSWVAGVEGGFSSVDSDQSERLGGFVTFRFNIKPNMPAELTLNAGHQFVENDGSGGSLSSGGEGAYGGVALSFSF